MADLFQMNYWNNWFSTMNDWDFCTDTEKAQVLLCIDALDYFFARYECEIYHGDAGPWSTELVVKVAPAHREAWITLEWDLKSDLSRFLSVLLHSYNLSK
jgi:hypothetical protein